MDPEQTEPWTNEKHLHFLNSMEASFVSTMLENNSRVLRLDRYLPDSSESTLDLKSQRHKKHALSVDYDASGFGSRSRSRSRTNGRTDKRTRRLSSNYQSQRHDASQDQVVPQIEERSGDKDERDPAVAAVAPGN